MGLCAECVTDAHGIAPILSGHRRDTSMSRDSLLHLPPLVEDATVAEEECRSNAHGGIVTR